MSDDLDRPFPKPPPDDAMEGLPRYLPDQLPRPSDEAVAESERIFRAWLNGEDTAPGAYDDAMEHPLPGWRESDAPIIAEWIAGDGQ
ncbi:MAG TPA: hypothetical protein VG708_09690 [Mycobacteriales bacterium]|nr:hypothetical protein [Mycobacteriales bacterium]